jgi:hypothetical protein
MEWKFKPRPIYSGKIQYHQLALPELCSVNQNVLGGIALEENIFFLFY